MNITLSIVAENPNELKEAISGLAGTTISPVKAQPKQDKPKQGGQNVSNPDPKKESDPAPTEDPNAGNPDKAPETETEEIPSIVDLRAKAQEKGTTPEGKKAIKALLDEIECKSISNVPEEKRAAFMHKLEEL